jgi:hypothetical protein
MRNFFTLNLLAGGLDVKTSYNVLKYIKFLKFEGLQRYRQFPKEREYLEKKWGRNRS